MSGPDRERCIWEERPWNGKEQDNKASLAEVGS